MTLPEYIIRCQKQTEAGLRRVLPSYSIVSERLVSAMSYSTLGGGKRLRSVLAYATCEALGGTVEAAEPAALAVELIHTYSLIHDDLPSMDNDDLRRGKPTCHKAFDEPTAILAGDALSVLAFEVLVSPEYCPDTVMCDATRLRLVKLLASCSGSAGMCGGQSMDLDAIGSKLSEHQLQLMHEHKTGSLIRASVLMGAYSSESVTDEQLAALTAYARSIGLAFQMQDDVLDAIGDSADMGKLQGGDRAMNKPTYVSVIGLEETRSRAAQLSVEAQQQLIPFGEKAGRLREIAQFVVERSY